MTGLSVSPGSARVFQGTTAPYIATATYSDGSSQDVTNLATWSVGSTSVATVNAQGVATAVSTYGRTAIKASYGGFNASGLLSAASFGTPVSYAHSSDFPVALVTADFNGDGRPDIATANYSGNSVGIYLNSNGTFPTEAAYGAGVVQPQAIAVGDLNGDGHPDLVVASPAGNQIGVLLNVGDGTFRNAVSYRVGSYPASIAVGDFNGDGRPDLAVVNRSSGSISILLNTGGGAFGPQTAFPVSGAYAVATADLDGDGWLDLAVAMGTNSVGVLNGFGDGTFNPPVTYTTGAGTYPDPCRVRVGDFNGDGKPDLATADQGGGTVSILLNSNGTFPTHTTYPVGGQPLSMVLADLNGDGRLDFVDVTNTGALVTVGVGNGNGTFQTPFSYSVGQSMNDVAVADFNGDSHPDIAYVQTGLVVMLQN